MISFVNILPGFARQTTIEKNKKKTRKEKDKKRKRQAGAELGQAQPELGFRENVLSLRGCARGWG